MPQIINTNVMSLNAQRNLNRSQADLQVSLARLSSGLRINSAKDDAAGLAIAERFTSQIRGLNQAQRNANDGISLSQVAEGALGSASDILQRVRELAIQSANDTNSSADRQALQSEVNELVAELDRLASTTTFNGRTLFDGTFGSSQFQVGANARETINASTSNFRTSQYGVNRVTGQASAGAVQADANIAVTRLGGETLAINGFLGSASITVAANSSANAVAQQVKDQVANTGVNAFAVTEVDATFAATGTYSFALYSNNAAANAVNVAFTLSGTTGKDALSTAVTAVNDQAAKTGVTAKVNAAGTGITLTNSTGENITFRNTVASGNNGGAMTIGGGALAATAAADANVVVTGQVFLESDRSFSASGDVGETLQAATAASTLNSVATLDVTTVTNANLAISIAESALNLVNGQRAKFGALQARFEATIRNLEISSENQTGARSRIQDADFAAETAALTRAQILQQAGVSVVSQANALPQTVLALLQ
jgi:flagellin